RLLDSYRIPVIGKTGYTVAAKKCFVGAGNYDGREIIVAVMGSRDLWGDTRRLLEFGFDGDLPPEVNPRGKRQHAINRAPATTKADETRVARPSRRGASAQRGPE